MRNRNSRGRSLGRRDRCSISAIATQHLGNRSDGIPITSGHGNSVEPVQCAEEADNLHVSPVQSDDESVSSREDLHQPSAAGRESHGR